MRISDWSSDVCSSDLLDQPRAGRARPARATRRRCRPRRARPGGDDARTHGASAGRRAAAAALRARRQRGDLVGQPGELNITLIRSEEHTSELQSLMRISYAVFCLKKKKHQEVKQDL